VLGRFEAMAWDEVTEAGGRLVKLVGDEAMFVCPPTVGAAKAAGSILAQCGSDDLPRARAGIAAGKVFVRGGDYFGDVVNLASRLVDTAPPNTILVDETYRRMLEERDAQFALEAIEPRDLKGIGRTQVWRLTQPGSGHHRPPQVYSG
jgi:adenylate cyclase